MAPAGLDDGFGRTVETKKGRQMGTHEIWIEGYRATGEIAQAKLLGRVEAETFSEACDKLCSPQDWQQQHGNYDHKNGTVWGCRLFNNEADARAAFG
jgi:hypothetical protein